MAIREIKRSALVTFSPEQTKSWTSSHNFVQFADDNRSEEEDIAVAKFINYMGENSLVWARDGGQVPAHVSINNEPEFANLAQAFLFLTGVFYLLLSFRGLAPNVLVSTMLLPALR